MFSEKDHWRMFTYHSPTGDAKRFHSEIEKLHTGLIDLIDRIGSHVDISEEFKPQDGADVISAACHNYAVELDKIVKDEPLFIQEKIVAVRHLQNVRNMMNDIIFKEAYNRRSDFSIMDVRREANLVKFTANRAIAWQFISDRMQ